jgi:hypothetical protein
VLRGQAFRDWGHQTVASSCCAQSLVAQREVYYAHERMVRTEYRQYRHAFLHCTR